MKYLVKYTDNNGEQQEDLKEFDNSKEFDTWEANQNSSGVNITQITNIHYKVMFKYELNDDELRMLIKNISRDVSHFEIKRKNNKTSVIVSDGNGCGFKVEQKNNIVSIHDFDGVDYTPSYFTREHVLMFMVMFETKYQFAD